ncbi:hypothetical protein NQ317_006437 [Molorchus minor]|uniref:Uncharacterized protein n=1 Tax=Molorchus minor TaxID=1323400 RepID=A0ABQ9IR80_9CUCU|nr:hypothetical protein NQ317_006437 [Molorchus minor]
MDLAISDEPVMCKHCSRSPKMAFDFKSTCLFTEELVMLFARGQANFPFSLERRLQGAQMPGNDK